MERRSGGAEDNGVDPGGICRNPVETATPVRQKDPPPPPGIRDWTLIRAIVFSVNRENFYFTVKQNPKQTRMFDSCASGNMKQIASQAPRFTNTTTSDKATQELSWNHSYGIKYNNLMNGEHLNLTNLYGGARTGVIARKYARRRRFLTNFILKDAPYRRPLLFIDCRQAYKPEYNWNSSRITSPTCFIRLQGGKRYWQAVPPLKFGQPIQNGSLPVKRAYNRIVNYAIGTSTASTVSSVNTCSTNNGTNVQFVTPHWSKLYKPLDMRRRLGGKRRTDSNKLFNGILIFVITPKFKGLMAILLGQSRKHEKTFKAKVLKAAIICFQASAKQNSKIAQIPSQPKCPY
ncbi:unnamed protein product [Nesidiocoris tenuis]|uniref:Uncharacterized protein n=1 Tax=Nesidiocoris tenuis TaxID=355587 RepID=A0A6H5HCM1_9HEMI|nr:unnamed protein product [Nesidiocoris tenuis]